MCIRDRGTPDRRVDNRSYREGVERHVNPCKKRDRAQRERQSTCKKTAVCVDTCCFLSSSQRECYKLSSCEHECVIQDSSVSTRQHALIQQVRKLHISKQVRCECHAQQYQPRK